VESVKIVSVEVKLGVPDDSAKLGVAPDGKPETDRLTVLSKSLRGDRETVALIDPP
jgi:hypothetical protein